MSKIIINLNTNAAAIASGAPRISFAPTGGKGSKGSKPPKVGADKIWAYNAKEDSAEDEKGVYDLALLQWVAANQNGPAEDHPANDLFGSLEVLKKAIRALKAGKPFKGIDGFEEGYIATSTVSAADAKKRAKDGFKKNYDTQGD